jgi:hypothetical protein
MSQTINIRSIILIKKLWLIIILFNISFIDSYGPTNRYPFWKRHERIDQNEIYSNHLLKPSYESIKFPSFAVVPELLHEFGGKFFYQREYSPELSRIYSQYLKKSFYSEQCSQSLDETALLTLEDFGEAFSVADQQIKNYENANEQYLSTDPRGMNFSAYIFVATLHSKYNEFTTQHLTNK